MKKLLTLLAVIPMVAVAAPAGRSSSSSTSSLIGGDCFDFEADSSISGFVGKVVILTRKCGNIQRVYEYDQFGSSVPSRYFLLAEDRSSNPHYLLKEGK